MSLDIQVIHNDPNEFIDELILLNHLLFDEYIDALEEFIQIEMSKYTEHIHYNDSDNESYFWIYKYRNFSMPDWDMNYIFRKYYPSMIRGSALILLFSILESTLNEIGGYCSRYSDVSQYKADNSIFDKIKEIFKNIEYRIFFNDKEYLINKNIFNSQEWRIIKQSQRVRNCYAHSHGQLKKRDESFMLKDLFSLHGNFILIEELALKRISENILNFYKNIFIK